jgi:uncharacterized protein YciI
MLFALVAIDTPNSVERRLAIRPEHLKHLEALGDKLFLAGPFLNEKEEGVGSIVIVEADSLEEAREMLNRDPFVREGLFEQVLIKPWRMGINKTNR